MNKYTPGPWYINSYGDCVSGNGIVLAEKPHGINPNWEANAYLIAAAPELLEELETTLKALDLFRLACTFQQDMIVPLWVNERIDNITFLIAKARGES